MHVHLIDLPQSPNLLTDCNKTLTNWLCPWYKPKICTNWL